MIPDFIWTKNRLVLEKEALKQNMMRVLHKPSGNTPKKHDEEEGGNAGKMQF
jgi:hypothetical protein